MGAANLSFLHKHASLISFGMGEAGVLADVLIGLPMLFGLCSHDAFQEYFELFDAALAAHDLECLQSRYREPFAAQEIWWGSFAAEDLEALVPQRETIRRLGHVLLDNYRTYERDVWNREASRLSRVAARIDRHFARRDRMGRWEEITGARFKTDTFYALLCSALEKGPNAASISYNQVIFYHATPEIELFHLISHEVGTHILIDVLKDIRRLDRFAFSDVYAAYESLARYYNSIVLDAKPEYDLETFHASRYAEIYAEVRDGSPDITPRELLLRGLEMSLRESNR
jgi:hypothetical protein